MGLRTLRPDEPAMGARERTATDGSRASQRRPPVPSVNATSGRLKAGMHRRRASFKNSHRQVWLERHGLVLALVACTSVFCGLLALALPPNPVRLVLLLVFIVLGPGCALLCHIKVPSALIGWTLAITASLTTVTLVSSAMIWAGTWHPLLAHVGLIVATTVLALVRILSMSGPAKPGIYQQAPADEPGAGDAAPAAPNGPAGLVGRWLVPILLVVAPLSWLLSLDGFTIDRVDYFGLTLVLGVPYVAAVVAVCGAFAIEFVAGAGRRRVLMACAILELLFFTRATSPLLFESAQYPWTYKHLGVVDLFLQYGNVVDSKDIYQLWPGFFAATAQLVAVAGVPSIDFVKWSPLFFSALQVLLAAGALRALQANSRVILLTTFILVASSWPETNYFSPQAFAYTLAFGLFTIVFVWLRHCPDIDADESRSIFGRAHAYMVRSCGAAPELSTRSRRRAGAAVVVVFLAITSSHQLTPFVVLVGLVGLTALGLVRPRYLPVLLGVVAALYVVPRMNVAEQFNILSAFDLFKNTSGNASEGWATAGQRFSALAVRGLAAAIWAAALYVAWLSRRNLGRVILPIVLGFSPFVFLLIGNYGGELIYRVYVFSLVWCALLIASQWDRLSNSWRGAVAATISAVVLALLSFAASQGTQGQVAFDNVSTRAVETAQYFYDNARPGSILVLGTPIFPSRLTANYRSFNQNLQIDPTLLDETSFRHARLDQAYLAAVTRYVDSFKGSGHYLAISRAMAVQADYFGYLPAGSLDALSEALRASKQWRIFSENEEVVIFERIGGS